MTNPSIEYMRRIRREERAKLLGLRRERVVKALDGLNLHGDSHAMLSQIAYAVHPHVGAWDAESCDHLRNVLTELIGDAREAASGVESHCACGAGGCHRGDESEEVGDLSVTSELREYVRIHETTTTFYTTMPPQMEDKPTSNGEKLLAIADRIDAQFARVCEQLELGNDKLDELSTSGATELYDLLKRTVGNAKHIADKLNAHNGMLKESERLRIENAKCAADAINKACTYLDLLRDAARDYKALLDKLNELRTKLSIINKVSWIIE